MSILSQLTLWSASRGRKIDGFLIASAIAAGLAACSTTTETVEPAAIPVASAAPASLPRERLVGRWGVASFREAKDRQRTEAQARAQCKLPYTIALGPTDGVMIHAADDPKLYELRLKSGGGKTYLGFDAPAGDSQDREVLQADANILVMRYVDPDVNARYGTMVYIRCGRA